MILEIIILFVDLKCGYGMTAALAQFMKGKVRRFLPSRVWGHTLGKCDSPLSPPHQGYGDETFSCNLLKLFSKIKLLLPFVSVAMRYVYMQKVSLQQSSLGRNSSLRFAMNVLIAHLTALTSWLLQPVVLSLHTVWPVKRDKGKKLKK